MEQREALKSLEKAKAKIIFAMILVTLSIPTLVSKTEHKVVYLLLALPLLTSLFYKRIRRINFKINSIVK